MGVVKCESCELSVVSSESFALMGFRVVPVGCCDGYVLYLRGYCQEYRRVRIVSVQHPYKVCIRPV